MKQKLLKFLVVTLVLTSAIAGCLFYAIYISPEKLTVDYHNITSSKIPKSMNDVTIGYFSDIYYLEFMDEKRLRSMFDEINSRDVDILLFGGDLFSDPTSEKINADTINTLTSMFASLDAPLGKFYVLGEKDTVSEDSKTLVNNILYNAGFENLTNKNTKLHNNSIDSINLIGLDYQISDTSILQEAFANTSEDSFNMLFTHTPDNITQIPENSANLIVAGHSLGGQIYIPLFGTTSRIEGAEKYYHGSYSYGNTQVVISNGLGTTKTDMRLFCPPEFTVFSLNSN